jgi:hypothetical protein
VPKDYLLGICLDISLTALDEVGAITKHLHIPTSFMNLTTILLTNAVSSVISKK